MNNSITFKQYRTGDLLIFAAILIVWEALIILVGARFFPGVTWFVSATAAVTTLLMMRWKGYALIHACLGGFVFCLATNLTGKADVAWQSYIIYMVGNAFSAFALFYFKLFTREEIRHSVWKSLLFALIVQVLMWIGRAIVSLFFGTDLSQIWGFFTTDSLSLIFTVVLIWIARRVDGLFEDQKGYLLRMDKQRRQKEREESQQY